MKRRETIIIFFALTMLAGACSDSSSSGKSTDTDTTTDSGSTIPVGPTYTDQYRNNVGTSFSAPLLSRITRLSNADDT